MVSIAIATHKDKIEKSKLSFSLTNFMIPALCQHFLWWNFLLGGVNQTMIFTAAGSLVVLILLHCFNFLLTSIIG